jgi:hypothetical protein
MTWHIDQRDGHVVIYGPGQLEIILHDFDATRAQRGDTPPPKLADTLLERHWRYPLETGLWLEGMSIRNPSDLLDRPALHVLHIGKAVSWHLPKATAEALHVLMHCAEGSAR